MKYYLVSKIISIYMFLLCWILCYKIGENYITNFTTIMVFGLYSFKCSEIFSNFVYSNLISAIKKSIVMEKL